jgi:hypothetical protein
MEPNMKLITASHLIALVYLVIYVPITTSHNFQSCFSDFMRLHTKTQQSTLLALVCTNTRMLKYSDLQALSISPTLFQRGVREGQKSFVLFG